MCVSGSVAPHGDKELQAESKLVFLYWCGLEGFRLMSDGVEQILELETHKCS